MNFPNKGVVSVVERLVIGFQCVNAGGKTLKCAGPRLEHGPNKKKNCKSFF